MEERSSKYYLLRSPFLISFYTDILINPPAPMEWSLVIVFSSNPQILRERFCIILGGRDILFLAAAPEATDGKTTLASQHKLFTLQSPADLERRQDALRAGHVRGERKVSRPMIKPSASALDAERLVRRGKLLSDLQKCVTELKHEGVIVGKARKVILNLERGVLQSLSAIECLTRGVE